MAGDTELLTGIDESTIRAELTAQGVSFLTVSENRVGKAGTPDDRQVVVCLHGNAGQAQQIEAIRILSALDGVRMVKVSPASWTILVISLAGAAEATGEPGE